MLQEKEAEEPRTEVLGEKTSVINFKKRNASLKRLAFWSGLRGEQTKTNKYCFCRSECVETRSNGSKACP